MSDCEFKRSRERYEDMAAEMLLCACLYNTDEEGKLISCQPNPVSIREEVTKIVAKYKQQTMEKHASEIQETTP